MKKTAHFLLALLTTIIIMMVVRAVGVTLWTIEGDGLSPALSTGDRVLVNRWSYGLRVGGAQSIFNYGRIGKQPVKKGDLVAFENPIDSTNRQIFICRCRALPGDTLTIDGQATVVPCLDNCAEADYYWLETVNPDNPIDSRTLGFIAEEHIIGRVVMVVYNHTPSSPLWNGWRSDRFLLPI
jgi:signal peptidase I